MAKEVFFSKLQSLFSQKITGFLKDPKIMLAETFMRFLAASITSRRDGLAFVNGSRERLTSYTPARVVCECTERKVSGAGQTWSRGC